VRDSWAPAFAGEQDILELSPGFFAPIAPAKAEEGFDRLGPNGKEGSSPTRFDIACASR